MDKTIIIPFYFVLVPVIKEQEKSLQAKRLYKAAWVAKNPAQTIDPELFIPLEMP